ncbi:hypothetical protein JCM5353_007374, partial [Sporobolomyces roseus]
MTNSFQSELTSLLTSPCPPSSIFIHSPSPSTSSSLSQSIQSTLSTLSTPTSSSPPTISQLLPKLARIDLESIHSTKQFFDSILNQFTSWDDTRWSGENELGVGNWDANSRGFQGLKIIKLGNNQSGEMDQEGRRQKKRRKITHGQQDEMRDIVPGEQEQEKWGLEWDFKVKPQETTTTTTKLQPIRNTIESFHHSLSTIYNLSSSSSSSSPAQDDDPFEQVGIRLSNYQNESIGHKDRRYILIEHGELLGDLASGASGGAGGTASAAKETGMGSTFTSTLHRLAQLSGLPITVIIISRFPFRKSRETLVGLSSPYILEYSPPLLENEISVLYSRFVSSPLSTPSPTSRLSQADHLLLFKTFLELLSMTLQSSIGNDLDQLSWYSSKLWDKCLKVVEESNPPIPPGKLDRLKIALQPYLNTTLSQIGQPRTSLSTLPSTSTSHESSKPSEHAFSGTIRSVPLLPIYLDSSSSSSALDPTPLRPSIERTPSTLSLSTPRPPQSFSSLTRSLPSISRYLLIASYLAAHNPPKSDVRMFVKVDDLEGVARKGKKSKRGSKKILAGVSSKKKK